MTVDIAYPVTPISTTLTGRQSFNIIKCQSSYSTQTNQNNYYC